MTMIKVCSNCGEEKEIIEKTTLCKECVKERKRIYTKTYFEKHKELMLERGKEYYKNNKEKHIEACLRWRENNKKHYLEIESIRKKKDRKLRPYVHDWRDSLKGAFDRLGRKKESKTIKILGYSAIQLKEHIENLFQDGMSWDNYGEWEIDHIKEICTFDKDAPLTIVNSLNNLQPLWREENLNKWLELKKKLKENGIQSNPQ